MLLRIFPFTAEPFDMSDAADTVFEIFPWNRNFETGIEKIDEQHKVLVEILNRLAWHFASSTSELACRHILDELLSYVPLITSKRRRRSGKRRSVSKKWCRAITMAINFFLFRFRCTGLAMSQRRR